MKKDKAVISKLEKSETGVLKGGFSLQTTFDVAGKFLGNNVNCIGGGWFDTNVNCTGLCTACNGTQSGPNTNP